MGSLGNMQNQSDEELQRKAREVFVKLDSMLMEIKKTNEELILAKEEIEKTKQEVNEVHKEQTKPGLIKRIFRRK